MTYTLNKTTEVIVRYDQTNDTDMFQVGRSTDPPIDMVLVDIQPGSSGMGVNYPTNSSLTFT